MVDGIFAIFDKIGDYEAWAECIYTGWKTLAFADEVPKNNGTGASGTWPISINGNADTATKLATARKFSISGTGLSATAQSFAGTGDITIPITLANALLAIAGITPSAGKLPVFTGANTAALATITDFAKTLLSKGSADDVRSAIGAVDVSGAGVVAGDVSNANAWWVKLGGVIPLIIQGGYNETHTNTTRTITYPVAFSSIIGAWIAEIASRPDSDWGELTSKPNNTQLVYYQNGRSTGAYWYAIGV